MKKTVAFLLAFLIFVAPMTTLVKADVVIGDNDETIINENATVLGRKLALMESLSDLALSGVTEFTISNTNDVDSYLDSLWQELGDAIDSLSDGTGFTEISNSLKSKYFTNLVQYQDYITNRGNYLAQLLPSGNPTTSLLSTFFANNIYGKQYTQHYDLALDMFRSLSAFKNDPDVPEPNQDYIAYILKMNGTTGSGLDFFWKNYSYTGYSYYGIPFDFGNSFDKFSYFCANPQYGVGAFVQSAFAPTNSTYPMYGTDILTLNIFESGDDLYSLSVNLSSKDGFLIETDDLNAHWYCMEFRGDNSNQRITNFEPNTSSFIGNYNLTNVSLIDMFQSISNRFRNVNIYVDGVPWSIVSDNSSSNPTLDIDGFLKIFGNDNPQQYQLQPNTKIDYDELYQVIYNAIRDNLPISQDDITYYDSHDTIYSPTIINNYGEKEGDESDLIDTILDYAVIPKFDTSIAQPMRAALTNGVVIMNNSITNVIPDEILFILGACFFLLLFAVVINRMIK